MRGGECADASADQFGQRYRVARFVAGLVHQPADQVEDVAHPVVEFRNQQVLLFAGPFAFLGRGIGQPQDHLDQRDAQGLGKVELGLRPVRAAPFDRLLPGGEALARGDAAAFAHALGRLFGISRPGNDLLQLAPPEHEIVARGPRNRDDERARSALQEALRWIEFARQLRGGEDAARRPALQPG